MVVALMACTGSTPPVGVVDPVGSGDSAGCIDDYCPPEIGQPDAGVPVVGTTTTTNPTDTTGGTTNDAGTCVECEAGTQCIAGQCVIVSDPGQPDGGTTDTGCKIDTDCQPGNLCDTNTHACVPDDSGPVDPGNSCGNGKILVCHLPPGNPANLHDICVGAPAVPAHLAHGDYLGACTP
jgi:hypothetical protein